MLSLEYHKLCKILGFVNMFHCKCYDNRPKIYTDERRHKLLKRALTKYNRTEKC